MAKQGLIQKIGVRLYMGSMRFEGMWALGLRRKLIALITGQRREVLNIFANVFIESFEGLPLRLEYIHRSEQMGH